MMSLDATLHVRSDDALTSSSVQITTGLEDEDLSKDDIWQRHQQELQQAWEAHEWQKVKLDREWKLKEAKLLKAGEKEELACIQAEIELLNQKRLVNVRKTRASSGKIVYSKAKDIVIQGQGWGKLPAVTSTL